MAVRGLCTLAVVGALAWQAPAAVAQPAARRAPEAAGDAQGQHLPAVQLRAGMHLIRAEVAGTAQQRQIGLMHRRDLAPNDGMLFIFEQPGQQCFWMKNTPTPLTAAFIDDEGRIVNLADMQPFDERGHCSARPVRYVLEMHQGWFARKGIKPGMKIAGGPFQR